MVRELTVAAALGFMACSSAPTTPATPTTLLLINGTCNAGQCTAVTVEGSPQNLPPFVGSEFGLPFFLGSVLSDSACLTFPGSVPLIFFGDTTIWTDANSVEVVATDSGGVIGETGPFIPRDAPGWRLSILENGLEQSATMTSACTP